MLKNNIVVFIFALSFFIGCHKENSNYPLEKRFWTIEDYKNVIKHIKYGLKSPNDLPTLNNPETKTIVGKLTDPQNYLILLDDNELGLKYKVNIGSKFFSVWDDMSSIYSQLNQSDQYINEIEYLKVWHFGLELQIKYFYLGNQEIINSSDEEDQFYTNATLKSNRDAIINNFNLYIDELKNQQAYSEKGIEFYNKGLKTYFIQMVDIHNQADFNPMVHKINSVSKKIQFESTKKVLNEILVHIESTKNETNM